MGENLKSRCGEEDPDWKRQKPDNLKSEEKSLRLFIDVSWGEEKKGRNV